MRYSNIIIIVTIIVSLCSNNILNADPSANILVELKSRWKTTSLLTEISEYVNVISNNYYWKFLDLLGETQIKNQRNDQNEYNLGLTILQQISNDNNLKDSLSFSLSMNTFAPKLEMYNNLLFEHLISIYGAHLEEVSQFDNCKALLVSGKVVKCIREFTDASEFLSNSLSITDASMNSDNILLIDQDHVYPDCSTVNNVPYIVLYGTLYDMDSLAITIHRSLVHLCQQQRIRYVFRPLINDFAFKNSSYWNPHQLPKYGHRQNGLRLNGFSVELQIKNMEYKVIDDTAVSLDTEVSAALNIDADDLEQEQISGFYFDTLKKRHQHLKDQLVEFRNELVAETSKIEKQENTNIWEMQDLGVQTSQTILKSSEPLKLLKDISQNFPMYANSLTRIRTNRSVKNEIIHNQNENNGFEQGDNMLFINDIPMDTDELDLFELDNILRNEASFIQSLYSTGLASSTVSNLFKLPTTPSSSDNMQPRVYVPIDDKDNQIIAWLNNLEDSKDSRYYRWSPTVRELLSPGWPNQLRYVRKNLYTGIVILDPTNLIELLLFAKAKYFVEANAPIRIGVILREKNVNQEENMNDFLKELNDSNLNNLISNKENEKSTNEEFSIPKRAIRLFWHLYQKSPSNGWNYLEGLAQHLMSGKDLTRGNVNGQFRRILGLDREASKQLIRTLDEDENINKLIDKSMKYINVAGIYDSNFIMNGITDYVTEETYRDIMMNRIIHDQMMYRSLVYNQDITDQTSFDTYWSKTNDNVHLRINNAIIEAQNKPVFVEQLPYHGDNKIIISDFIRSHQSDNVLNDVGEVAAINYYIVCDLSTTNGQNLALATINYLLDNSLKIQTTMASRILLLPYFSSYNILSKKNEIMIATILQTLLKDESKVTSKKSFKTTTSAVKLIHKVLLLLKIFKNKKVSIEKQDLIINQLLNKHKLQDQQSNDEEWGMFIKVMIGKLGIKLGESNIIMNGMKFDLGSIITKYEFILLDSLFGNNKLLLNVKELVSNSAFNNIDADKLTSAFISDVTMITSWVLSRRKSQIPQQRLQFAKSLNNHYLKCKYSCFEISSIKDKKSEFLNIVAVIDPLSHGAQHLSSILNTLVNMFEVNLRVHLNPRNDISDLPLKRFYRVAAPKRLDFDDNGNLLSNNGVKFRNLRSKNVLSFNIHTPEAWLVQSMVAPYDLDNLRLEEITGTLGVEFQLEHILWTGQCIDQNKEQPSGLQLMLGKNGLPHVTDTVVMQNLGYFQMKADAGIWNVDLMGKGKELYNFDSKFGKRIVISSFTQPMQTLEVVRKPNTENEDLFDSNTNAKDKKGVWNRVTSYFSSNKEDNEEKDETNGDYVNVFSIASGHLYERFLKIMMLSVIKNTKSKVKFWFVKNFLSPQFKEFVPKMAKKYNFQVELVTYKWPRWLRRQSEKQRIIWGHKILFLDTLFPLSERRVIFVDADQVVRGDISELWNMDLHGAPYGYTPFCDSNKDTEGFRFWKQGYWQNHLRGKPYHISALYVVDLDRFRAIRAGDELRGIYDNLSRDPNSLANLDQDLPNYAQHMVPIYSLPQPWLWCQTWCSMDELPKAKTIDLCNNPLTKTPKLEVARTLLPEWTKLDEEARSITFSDNNEATSNKLHSEL